MNPRAFVGQNMVYRGPQPGIGDLPCQRMQPGMIRSVWELSPEDRVAIAEGADIELVIFGEPIPPVSVAIYRGLKLIEGSAP